MHGAWLHKPYIFSCRKKKFAESIQVTTVVGSAVIAMLALPIMRQSLRRHDGPAYMHLLVIIALGMVH